MTLPSYSLAAALAAILAAGSATLPRADVLVELFTSQGCSSCPPADAVLAELAGRDDVVALAFHVDYWDYLGWRDTFAKAEHTARQIDYRDAWNDRVVYTPQAVIHGSQSVTAGSRSEMLQAIEAVDDHAAGAGIRIDNEDGMLKAQITPGEMVRPCTVWIAKYTLAETVAIERGENAGRELTYHNVVTSLDRIGDWDGTGSQTVMLPQPEAGEGVAVWLQDGPGGPILAAADYRP